MKMLPTVSLMLYFAVFPAVAANAPLGFEEPEKQQRYEELLEEIRCLVCQNQSLADSGAGLAQDLRREIHTMIDDGRSEAAITAFLVDRYGDFVLYRPPLKRTTWLLWFGPFILLLAALVIVVLFVRSRRPAEDRLSSEEHKRATRLLEDSDDTH